MDFSVEEVNEEMQVVHHITDDGLILINQILQIHAFMFATLIFMLSIIIAFKIFRR